MMSNITTGRRRAGRRTSCLMAGVIFIASVAWIASPQSTSAATIGTDILRLRSGPGSSYDIMARMYQDEYVEILDGPSNGWYKVEYDGVIGWAHGDYISFGGTSDSSASIGTDVLRLRTGPATDYRTITFMYQGEAINVVDGPENGFYKVEYEGSVGWAYGDYIDFDGSSSSGSSGTAWVNTDRLRVRGSASLDGAVWGHVIYGDDVWLTGVERNGFYQISWDGGTAWVYADYITSTQPSTRSNKFWVPTKKQEHSLSCEYASLEIATTALGDGVWEGSFINVVGKNANPHLGFRGNIDGRWGGTINYGVYPEALRSGLNYFGFSGYVFYGGKGDLQWYLDNDYPTLVWIDLWYNSSFRVDINGDMVTLASGIHVVVAYGYDGEGVYVSDPARNAKRLIPWSDFMAMWSSVDQMALAVGW